MVKRIISMLLVFVIIFSLTTVAFAAGDNEVSEREIVKTVNDQGKHGNLSSEIKESKDGFSVRNDVINFIAPELLQGDISLDVKDNYRMSIGIEEGNSFDRAMLVNGNTLLYRSAEGDRGFTLQVTEDKIGNETFFGFRTAMVLTLADSECSVTYRYGLPAGCRFVDLKEYLRNYANEEEINELKEINNVIFVLDPDDNILLTIDGLEAFDGNGERLPTSYKILGNKIVQFAQANSDTQEPITICANSHPSYNKTRYLTKGEVKKVYNGMSTDFSLYDLVDKIYSICSRSVLPSVDEIIIKFLALAIDQYDAYQRETWKGFYNTMSSNSTYKYLREITRYHYHPGKRCYYPQNIKYAYTQFINA